MIVRQGDGALHLITQPDHAALAAQMVDTLQPLAAHPRRASILLAVREHDGGWREPDAAPMVDPATGRILDFIHVPVDVRQGVWPRGIEPLTHDPWAAALVAHHAVTVYDRFRGDAVWDAFFATLAARRDALVATAGRALDVLREDYVFLRLADLLSLSFCTRASEPASVGGWTVRPTASALELSPAGFDGEVPFAIDAREIADAPYPTHAALAAALAAAPVRRLRGVIRTAAAA